MIPETENPQEAKSVCPALPVRYAKDLITQSLGMLSLIRVDTLRRVRNVGFLVERLINTMHVSRQ